MGKQVIWTAFTLKNFEEMAMLDEVERFILETRCKGRGMPISEQARRLNMSEATVNRYIKKIKEKYDAVQRENPDLYPIRKKSAKEEYMDTH